jgi:hypothetical protein
MSASHGVAKSSRTAKNKACAIAFDHLTIAHTWAHNGAVCADRGVRWKSLSKKGDVSPIKFAG